MGTYTAYRLKFKTQLHLGRATGAAQTGSLGLEKTETFISADTLFSALCQTWATFYDTESLTDFLNQYTAKDVPLPFTLTSAFPFAQDICFFPKPLTFTPISKKGKRLQFVSYKLFQQIISGNPPDFDEDEETNLITGEKVWVSPDEKAELKHPDIWQTSTRPRVTIDRQTDESSIWHVQTVQFNTDCGLWFAANYGSDETQKKIETLLRVVGDNGIGGERNAGYGLFGFAKADVEIPTVEGTAQSVTLSPICPKSPDQLEHLIKDDVAYSVNPLTGWVGSQGTHKRRKNINMFTEGSVLNSSDEPVGSLVDLRPEGWEHPVYRYGYAWQVGIKGASE